MNTTFKIAGFVFCLFTILLGSAQENPLNQVLEEFEAYSELPREMAYVHLNKSVFLNGEPIGYKAYILDKENLKPSTETTNLYLVIKDRSGKTIKSDLIRVESGTASGAIQLDSLFASGEYTLKAYTNWMLNFQESNHFEQSILVIDPKSEASEGKSLVQGKSSQIHTHVLPEGGHAPVGIETNFGVIIKDAQGYGIGGIQGSVLNQANEVLTTFKVNAFGLGRFGLSPAANTQYRVEYQYDGNKYTTPLTNIQPLGTGIKLQALNDQVLIRLSSTRRQRSEYSLSIHNGSSIKAIPVPFNNEKETLVALKKEDLYPGLNIMTVFDQKGKPILERLFFNDFGWEKTEASYSIDQTQEKDSVQLKLTLPQFDPQQLSSLSIAVLPETSIASNSHHSLTTFAHLAPHLKTPIQNAQYYFNNPSAKKWFELDLVMMTQGWSAYDWNTIQRKKPEYRFDFEKGISVNLTENTSKGQEYFVYPMAYNNSAFTSADASKGKLTLDYLYPIQDEKLSLSVVKEKGGLAKPGVYAQFKPSAIPEVALTRKETLPDRWQRDADETDLPTLDLSAINDIRQLDEVVVMQNKVQKRRENIKNRTAGNVDFFDDDDPRRNQLLSIYLSGRGYIVNETPDGNFSIRDRTPNTPNNPVPAILLDDVLLSNYQILWRFRMDIVDYIEINKSGLGGGLRFGGGVIKIYTDPTKSFNFKSTGESVKTSYDIPLTFTTPDQYFAPRFESYNSASFLRYGTLHWEPNVSLNEKGEAVLRFPKSRVPEVTIDLQGMYNGKLFSQRLNLGQKP